MKTKTSHSPTQIHESEKLFLSHKKYYEISVSIWRMEIEIIIRKKNRKKILTRLRITLYGTCNLRRKMIFFHTTNKRQEFQQEFQQVCIRINPFYIFSYLNVDGYIILNNFAVSIK